jgi:hypothetical protein
MIPLVCHENAMELIIDYIHKYHEDEHKMQAVFRVVYKKLSVVFEKALLTLLEYNQDVNLFRELQLTSDGGIYSGDTIVGELRANEWRGIQKIVNKHLNQFEVRSIQRFINQQIKYCLARAETERDRVFSRKR